MDAQIKDEDKQDDIKSLLRSLPEKVVDLMSDVAQSIASVTSLAPFSKSIGKGASYFGDLIKKKLKRKW